VSLTTERPRPPATHAPRGPRGDRLVGGTLLFVGVLLVAYQLLAGHLIPPLAIFGALTLVLGAATLRRRPRWLLVTDVVVATVYLVGSLPFMVANLAHPESPVSFLTEVFLLVAFLTVITGAVLRLRGAGDPARRSTVIGAAGVAGLATVVSLVAAVSLEAEAQRDGDVPLVTERSVFPADVEVPAGEAVLWIDNQDPFHHTFVIDDTDVRVVMAANSSVRVPVDLAPGSHRFWCDVPGHESMEGMLHVR
jgi:plastocyanin